MTVFVRIGLGVLLTLAPALWCCHARWLTSRADAAAPECCAPAKPVSRVPVACPHCQAEAPTEAPVQPETPGPPPAPSSPHCIFCDGQATVIPTDPRSGIEPPAFAGEWLPVLGWLAAVLPAHPAFQAGVFPPERAGVDARSAALFDRHVMHC